MGFNITVNWQTSPAQEGEFCRDHSITFGSGQTIQLLQRQIIKAMNTM